MGIAVLAEVKHIPNVGKSAFTDKTGMTFTALMQNRKKTRMMKSNLINRQNAIDVLELLADKMSDEGKTVMAQAVAVLKDLQSAEPEEEVFEWCHDCKEYDQEKHCCHRWTKVIRQTIDEMKAESERTAMVWKPAKGRPAYEKGICSCGYVLSVLQRDFVYCPNCGARLEWGE